jgi:hypothetical protein
VIPKGTEGAVVMSAIVSVGFAAVIVVLCVVHIDFSALAGQAFLVLSGMLAQAFGTAVNYWLGSSAGSAAKSNTIEQMKGVQQ